jgi:HK97 gp10 family phage protein
MANDRVKVTLRTVEAQAQIERAVLRAVTETFELDIKARAKELSPVSPEWPSIPEARGEKRIDTGENRRSIDTEVTLEGHNVKAVIFTQSGHGGYLEIGTSRMPARPYINPAVTEFVKKIPTRVRAFIRG